MGHAFDAWRWITGIANGLYHTISDGADMCAGAACGDEHGIGYRRLALQIDRNDLFGLGVIKACQNIPHQSVDVGINGTVTLGKRRVCSFKVSIGSQRFDPLNDASCPVASS